MRDADSHRRGWERQAALAACLLGSLVVACSSATSRHRVLSIFFDGVPSPVDSNAEGRATLGTPDGAAEDGAAAFLVARAHGPYAAKQCDACHDRQANNALVAPREELCFRCHDLRLDKAFIHGPLASGGCLVCHDPHTSGYSFLLVAESGTFCVRCHDAASVTAVPAHDGAGPDCTSCHDAHMSDRRYLLK